MVPLLYQTLFIILSQIAFLYVHSKMWNAVVPYKYITP